MPTSTLDLVGGGLASANEVYNLLVNSSPSQGGVFFLFFFMKWFVLFGFGIVVLFIVISLAKHKS